MPYPEKHFLLSAIEVTDVTSKKPNSARPKACEEVGGVIADANYGCCNQAIALFDPMMSAIGALQ